MNTTHTGYSPFQDPNVMSLAEGLRRFEALPDETASRKARARSAVSVVARLVGKPAADIPAQPNVLMRLFPKLKHRSIGLSAKSLANCKTELRHLLEKIGAGTGRSWFRSLSPEWTTLRDCFLDDHPYLCVRTSRFMAFCTALEIAPEQVDNSVLEKFREALIQSGEVDRPERKVRETVGAWNKLAAMAEPTLPRLYMAPKKVRRATIELEKFTQSFRDDVAKWQTQLAYVDPEADEGPTRALRPASLSSYRFHVLKAASALVSSGHPIESVTSLQSLVEIDAFKALLKYLREQQGGKPTPYLLGLAMVLKSVATNYVKLGDDHIARMARICSNYQVEEQPTRTHERLKVFEDERLLAKILHLPEALFREAMSPKTRPQAVRILAQIAVALEVEFQAPFRLKNLNTLRLGENIQPITVGGQPRWMIRFSPDETKNRKPLVFEIPTDSVRFIERCFRLYERPDSWLFPGERDGHKDRTLLGRQMKDVVEQRLGVPFHAHMLRGLVATLQVKESPAGFENARAMLGDNNDRVIRKHYTSTAEQHLIRKAQNTIKNVRARTAPIVPDDSKRRKAA